MRVRRLIPSAVLLLSSAALAGQGQGDKPRFQAGVRRPEGSRAPEGSCDHGASETSGEYGSRAIDRRIVPQRRGQSRRGCADSSAPSRGDAAQPCLGPAGAKVTHEASARLVDRLRTRFTFQISVDVATVEQGSGLPARRWRRGHHRRNGDAAAQERRRLERRASLPSEVSRGAPAGRHEDNGWRRLRGARRLFGRRQHRRFPRARRRGYGEGDCAVRDEFRRADLQCRGSSSPISSCRTRARPHRPSRSRFACSRPVWTRSAFTCRPTRGAPTRHSSSATISVTWPAPSSSGSAAPPRCRLSAGSASRRRKASPRRGCAPSSSAAISASRTAAPATTCHRTRSSATSPVSSPRSRARDRVAAVAGLTDPLPYKCRPPVLPP